MQASQFVDDTKAPSEPSELDRALWHEVVGGSPKGGWTATFSLDRVAATKAPAAT